MSAEEVEFHLVGVTYDYRQRFIAGLSLGDPILLHPQPDNPVDQMAIAALTTTDHQIGYLARPDAERWHASIPADGLIARVTKLLGGTAEKPSRGVIVTCRLAASRQRAPAIGSAPVAALLPAAPLRTPDNAAARSAASVAGWIGLGVAAGALLAAITLNAYSSMAAPQAPDGEPWWREIGDAGGEPPVLVVERVPFGLESDVGAYRSAMRALCHGGVRCRIAFLDVRWPLDAGNDTTSASLLAFYDSTGAGDGLQLDCGRYQYLLRACLPGTQPPPPADASAPLKKPAKPLRNNSSR